MANVGTGVFLRPDLTAVALAAWAAVFGGRSGGGVTVAIGHAQENRAPRHALLIGAILAHLDFLDEQIGRLSDAIEDQIAPFRAGGG